MRHISLRLLTLSLVMLGPMGVCAAQDGGDAARASAQTLDGASAQAVDIAVDLTERLAVKDWDSEQVRVESTSGGQAAPDCAVGVRQTGKTIEITQRADQAGACSAAMDLTVLVPRRYDVSITAKVAREVRGSGYRGHGDRRGKSKDEPVRRLSPDDVHAGEREPFSDRRPAWRFCPERGGRAIAGRGCGYSFLASDLL